MYQALTPMLICDDVPASIAFYTEVLGLGVEGRMDDVGKSGWASLTGGPVHLMLASRTYLREAPKVDGRFPQCLYYFYVAALRERAQSKGAEPTEIVQRFYDKLEFELVDPSGHVLVFGQEHAAPEPKA